MEWIACKDKMPELDHKGSDYSKEVLVVAQFDHEGKHYFRYETAYWSTHSEVWFMDGGAQEVENVTHWQSLTPPPESA